MEKKWQIREAEITSWCMAFREYQSVHSFPTILRKKSYVLVSAISKGSLHFSDRMTERMSE